MSFMVFVFARAHYFKSFSKQNNNCPPRIGELFVSPKHSISRVGGRVPPSCGRKNFRVSLPELSFFPHPIIFF